MFVFSLCCKKEDFFAISLFARVEKMNFVHFCISAKLAETLQIFFFIQLFIMCTIDLSEMIDVTKSCRVCKYVTQQA